MNKFSDILKICRLCLVEEKVNHAIFEESGDLRSIFLKISSCLPVSVNKDDGLPEKICDTCSTKLDSFYQFWNETANAEKQLLHWLSVNKSLKQNQIADTSKRMETPEVKQEEVDPIDMSSDAQTYILQQQQLPYAAAATDSVNTSESEEPISKRPRRASAVKALEQMESEDEDDPDNYAKSETDESEKDEEEEETNYQENPSTTSVEDQPGPSGLASKKMVLDDTPSLEPICQVFVDEDSDKAFCCGKEFTSPNAKKKHLRQHHGSKKFSCAECSKMFACSYQLKLHAQTHLETKEFKCNLCERSFKTDKYLENHMNYNHIRGNFRHQCSCCDKSYRSEKELSQHVGTKHLGIVYKCDICFKEFYSDMYLKKHMLQHDDSYVPPSVPCTQCDKVFSCKRSLTVHVESFHNGIRHICEICGKSLSTQYSLRLHMRTHSDEKPFECEICGKKFAKSSTRQDHLRIHTKQRPHVCPKCGKGFTQRTPLITHIKSVHGSERPFQCPMCPKAFATKSLLKTHSKVHGKPLGSAKTIESRKKDKSGLMKENQENENINVKAETRGDRITGKKKDTRKCKGNFEIKVSSKYKRTGYRKDDPKNIPCKICNRRFTFNHLLKIHFHNDVEKNEYRCSICGDSFGADSDLKTHLTEKHAKEAHKLKCDHCGKGYTYEGDLSRHIRIKHEGLIYKCEQCGKTFNRSQALEEHIHIKHDETYVKPKYPCAFCDKIFSCKKTMTLHIKNIHYGLRHFYVCDMCGKSLATPNSFRNHIRTHTKDKPFECSVCGKKFGRNHHLQDHLVTHTKEKPHICSRCGKAFTQRAPLLRHMKCVHETARPYQCLICSKSFATKSLLNSHAKLHNIIN